MRPVLAVVPRDHQTMNISDAKYVVHSVETVCIASASRKRVFVNLAVDIVAKAQEFDTKKAT